MRHVATALGRSKALAAIRLLGEWRLDRARSEATQAAVRSQAAQAHADGIRSEMQQLVDWSRAADGGQCQPAIHGYVLAGLGRIRQQQEGAVEKCDALQERLRGARQTLVLVQARQKALDRVAQRIAERTALQAADAQAREADEQWLRLGQARGRGR